MYICGCFAYIFYEGKWQGCHSERPSQVGGVGQLESYEIQRGQMQSPASGKKETLAEIQAELPDEGETSQRTAWARGSPKAGKLKPKVTQCCLSPHIWGTFPRSW